MGVPQRADVLQCHATEGLAASRGGHAKARTSAPPVPPPPLAPPADGAARAVLPPPVVQRGRDPQHRERASVAGSDGMGAYARRVRIQPPHPAHTHQPSSLSLRPCPLTCPSSRPPHPSSPILASLAPPPSQRVRQPQARALRRAAQRLQPQGSPPKPHGLQAAVRPARLGR